MKEMVKISDLSQTFYSKDGELEVLKNINFNLIEGEILTLLGPSGSGKSTILNILTNLLKPTSGDVIINGKIGYMFQKDHLLDWRNIMDNITIGLEIQKQKTDEAMKRVERLLKTYDLWILEICILKSYQVVLDKELHLSVHLQLILIYFYLMNHSQPLIIRQGFWLVMMYIE